MYVGITRSPTQPGGELDAGARRDGKWSPVQPQPVYCGNGPGPSHPAGGPAKSSRPCGPEFAQRRKPPSKPPSEPCRIRGTRARIALNDSLLTIAVEAGTHHGIGKPRSLCGVPNSRIVQVSQHHHGLRGLLIEAHARVPLTVAAVHDEFADVLAALRVAQSERMDLAMRLWCSSTTCKASSRRWAVVRSLASPAPSMMGSGTVRRSFRPHRERANWPG